MAMAMVQTYARAVVATTNVNFSIGTADALLLMQAPQATVTLTLPDSTTVAIDASAMLPGQIIPIACTKAVFATGTFVAMKVA